jgi:hypothetical protein
MARQHNTIHDNASQHYTRVYKTTHDTTKNFEDQTRKPNTR